MSHAIDLSEIPVIDNHCHSIHNATDNDAEQWKARFSEALDPDIGSLHVQHTAFFNRLMRRAPEFFGTTIGDIEGLLRFRSAQGSEALVGKLFRDANIGGVVVDTGYPDPTLAMSPTSFEAASGTKYVALLRLEVEFQKLIVRHADFEGLFGALDDLVSNVREMGFVGFKSIAAYRTGLNIGQWSDDEARGAFRLAREEVDRTGNVRLGYKPLLDTMLHAAFLSAASQNLPVQFHVGYGDPDVDLRSSSPLELRSLFENPAYHSMPIVLLHGCWPYFREGGYLASVYANAYLDLSYGIPFLSRAEMTSMTRAALGVAPFSKIMYSSDGVGIPELHWLGALEGRHAIGTVLGEMVEADELNRDQAEESARLILNQVASEIYGLKLGTV